MATFRKISEKVIDITPEGDVVTFFEGYCDDDYRENVGLPTTNVCEGSNVIVTDTGWWYFFTEETKEWLPKLNIGEVT